jgi:hypothetical protein
VPINNQLAVVIIDNSKMKLPFLANYQLAVVIDSLKTKLAF